MLTKKHFTALAKMVASYTTGQVSVYKLAYDLAAICAKDNPQFDRAKFLEACGADLPPTGR